MLGMYKQTACPVVEQITQNETKKTQKCKRKSIIIISII